MCHIFFLLQNFVIQINFELHGQENFGLNQSNELYLKALLSKEFCGNRLDFFVHSELALKVLVHMHRTAPIHNKTTLGLPISRNSYLPTSSGHLCIASHSSFFTNKLMTLKMIILFFFQDNVALYLEKNQ